MKIQLIFITLILILGVSSLVLFLNPNKNKSTEPEPRGSITITSSAFQNNDFIPTKYTCVGENINPPLNFNDIPNSSKSLVLIVDDLDAPAGTWTHWLVWNINPAITHITEGEVPAGGIEGQTSFGKPGYGGPCPPSSTHRYFFKLFALDSNLDLPTKSDRIALEKTMAGHLLEKSELVGLYGRR